MLLLRPYPVVAIGTMLTEVRFVLSLSILWSSLRSIDVRSSLRPLGNPTVLGLFFVKTFYFYFNLTDFINLIQLFITSGFNLGKSHVSRHLFI